MIRISDLLWVFGGGAITALLVIALLYWGINESRAHRRTRASPPARSDLPAKDSDPTGSANSCP